MREVADIFSKLEQGYQPSPETTEAIKNKSLLAFIGAFAVGKSTLMRKVAQVDDRFSEVISFTTRPSRGEGDTYRFINNEVGVIGDIVLKAKRGDLVNFAVHPTTGYIYGTEPNDYRSEICMLATTANSYQLATSKLPFHSVDPVVVVLNPAQWASRIFQRSVDLLDHKNRLSEAKQSLEWSLAQSDITFIDNTDTNITDTAVRFIHDWTTNEARHVHQSRWLAEKMLAYVKASE